MRSMRTRTRVALVSLAIATGGLAGCSSLDKPSDTTAVSSEYPPAKTTPGEETSEPSAKDGESEIKTADTPSQKKDKPAQKLHRRRTAKAPAKPAAPARAAAAQPQTPELKSPPAQGEPFQHPWPAAPAAGTFSR